jgi:hypothetical protein
LLQRYKEGKDRNPSRIGIEEKEKSGLRKEIRLNCNRFETAVPKRERIFTQGKRQADENRSPDLQKQPRA